MSRRSFVQALLSLIGCFFGGRSARHTRRQMSAAEFEDWLRSQLEFSEVFLADRGQGHFVGTGKRAGQSLRMRAAQLGEEVVLTVRPDSA